MARKIVTLQTRRGNSSDFDATKMLSGEMATVEDTEQAYISFADGTAEELALKRDINNGGGTLDRITVTALSAQLNASENGEGYGTCIVVHNAESCFVFDLGYDKITEQNSASKTLIDYLNDNGMNTINALFISHYHSDHVRLAAIQDIVDKDVAIEKIVLPHKNIDWAKINSDEQYSGLRDSIVSYADQNGIDWVEPEQEGSSLGYGDITIKCYNVDAAPGTSASPGLMYDYYYNWPYNQYYQYKLSGGSTPANEGVPENNYNNFSMVNVVEFAGKKIVIAGDIMEPAQRKMVDVLTTADLLFIPHHGLDTMIAHELFNRMYPELAIINSAYDKSDLLTEHATRAFAGKLLQSGVNVRSTYTPAGAAAPTKMQCAISQSGINIVEPGVPVSANILPCAIAPYTDLNTLPDGRYMQNYEWQTSTLVNKPGFKKNTAKFIIDVVSTSRDTLERTQTAYTIDTSAVPEIARRSMVGSTLQSGTWHSWGVIVMDEIYNHDGKIQLPASSGGLNSIMLYDNDGKRYCTIEGRASDHLLSFFIFPKDGGENYRRYSLPAAPNSLSENEYYTIAVK